MHDLFYEDHFLTLRARLSVKGSAVYRARWRKLKDFINENREKLSKLFEAGDLVEVNTLFKGRLDS